MKRITFILGAFCICAALGCSDPAGPAMPKIAFDELPMAHDCTWYSPSNDFKCGTQGQAVEAYEEATGYGFNCDFDVVSVGAGFEYWVRCDF